MWGVTFAFKSKIALGNGTEIALRRCDFVPKSHTASAPSGHLLIKEKALVRCKFEKSNSDLSL